MNRDLLELIAIAGMAGIVCAIALYFGNRTIAGASALAGSVFLVFAIRSHRQ